MFYYDSSYNSEYDCSCGSDEEKNQAQEENDKAIELYREGLSLYNSGHYNDAISKFSWAKDYAHDRDLIKDCDDMIRDCNEALADLYMR